MDPGTVIGVVSLALQTCQGIISICSAWSSYDDDIKNLAQYIRQLSVVLTSVKEAFSGSDTADEHLVEVLIARINVCRTRLGGINRRLMVDDISAAQTRPRLRDKLVDTKDRLLFPLRKEDISLIKKDICDIVQLLNMVIDAAQMKQRKLDSQILIHIAETADANRDNLNRILATTQASEAFVSQYPQQLKSSIDMVLAAIDSLAQQQHCVQQSISTHNITNEPHSLALELVTKPSLHQAVIRCSGMFGATTAYESPTAGFKRVKQPQPQQRRKDMFRCRFLSYSIRLSFMTFATGHSFTGGPILDVRRVVPANSPVFQALKITRSPIPQEMEKGLLVMQHRLDELFRNGQASAKDVDPDGRTLFDVLSREYIEIVSLVVHSAAFQKCLDLFLGLIVFLIQRGFNPDDSRLSSSMHVPKDDANTNRDSVMYLLSIDSHITKGNVSGDIQVTREYVTALPRLLFQNGLQVGSLHDRMINAPGHQIPPLYVSQYLFLCQGSLLSSEIRRSGLTPFQISAYPTISEGFDLTDIQQAILDRDEALLLRCLDQGQHYDCKHSILEMSLLWPRGVSILIAGHIDVNERGLKESAPLRALALERACNYKIFDSVQILLDAGSDLYHDIFGILEPEVRRPSECSALGWAIASQVPEIIRSVISELVKRRRRLKELALATLPDHLTSHFGLLTPSLPDKYASDIIKAIQDSGEIVPRRLLVSRGMGTVYYESDYLTPDIVDMLWEAGFHDLCTDDQPHKYMTSYERVDAKAIELAAWFNSKGARAYIPGNPSALKTRHMLAWRCLCYEDHVTEVDMYGKCTYTASVKPFLDTMYARLCEDAYKFFLELLVDNQRDNCKCPCSPLGCIAPSQGMKRLWYKAYMHYSGKLEHAKQIPRLLKLLQGYIDVVVAAHIKLNTQQSETLRGLELDLIRFLTFERLGMKHTCCNISTRWRYGMYGGKMADYMDEHCEEQRELSRQLDFLMVEFREMLLLDQPILEFIRGPWETHMYQLEQLLAEDDPVDEEYMRAVRSIGVRVEE